MNRGTTNAFFHKVGNCPLLKLKLKSFAKLTEISLAQKRNKRGGRSSNPGAFSGFSVERISKTYRRLVVKENSILVWWISEPWSGRAAVLREMVCWQKKVLRASAFASVITIIIIVFVADAETTLRSGRTVFYFFLAIVLCTSRNLWMSLVRVKVGKFGEVIWHGHEPVSEADL